MRLYAADLLAISDYVGCGLARIAEARKRAEPIPGTRRPGRSSHLDGGSPEPRRGPAPPQALRTLS